MAKQITITFNADTLTVGEIKSVASTMRTLMQRAYRLKERASEVEEYEYDALTHKFFVDFLKTTAHLTTDQIKEKQDA